MYVHVVLRFLSYSQELRRISVRERTKRWEARGGGVPSYFSTLPKSFRTKGGEGGVLSPTSPYSPLNRSGATGKGGREGREGREECCHQPPPTLL